MSDDALDAYQRAAARTINPALDDEARLLDAACGMAEEAGEVLALVRKHVMHGRALGRALDRARLVEELGDALWCLAIVARTADVTLAEVAEANIAKLRHRHPAGFDTGPR